MIWPQWARTGTVAFIVIVVVVSATTATAGAQQDPIPAPSSTSPSTTAPTTLPAPPSSTAIPSTTTPPSSTAVPPVTDTSPPSTTPPAPLDTNGSVSAQAVPAGSANEVFARGTDGALWWRQLTAAGWSLWQSFGGGVIGAPAAVSRAAAASRPSCAAWTEPCTGDATTAPRGPGGAASADFSRAIRWCGRMQPASTCSPAAETARARSGQIRGGRFLVGVSPSGRHGVRSTRRRRGLERPVRVRGGRRQRGSGCSDSSMTSREASWASVAGCRSG